MKKQGFGSMIAALRKEKGMTQLELAEKMCVTDKAVSKWERGLSYPDISSLPKLAEIFDISVDELMQETPETHPQIQTKNPRILSELVLKGVALAMGIAVTVLSVIKEIEPRSAVQMLGIGLICLTLSRFPSNNP